VRIIEFLYLIYGGAQPIFRTFLRKYRA